MLLPTIEDLFGGSAEAIQYYKDLFAGATETDEVITEKLTTAFTKIDPLFGEFRSYVVGEDTVRNIHIQRAVCFEANSMLKANAGDLNTGSGVTGKITSERVEDVSVTYDNGSSLGLGSDAIKQTLGLLSSDASILLSRYIRKTYGMGA